MKKKVDSDKLNCPYCNELQKIERINCQAHCNSCLHIYTIGITSKGFVSLWKKSSTEKSTLNKLEVIKHHKTMNDYLDQNIGESIQELFGFSQIIGMKSFEFYKWAKDKKFTIYYDKIVKMQKSN
jgi:hypothetical protein